MSAAADRFGLTLKPGYLATFGEGIEESLSLELWERAGYSVDIIATEERVGAGLAKDIWRGLDAGVYATSRYDHWEPRVGVGLHWGF